MQISIGKNGARVKLTKREQQTLRESQALCEQIAKIDDGEPANAVADHLVDVIATYCEPTKEGK